MKKFLSLILCAVMVLSMAACGAKDGASQDGGDLSPANQLKAQFVELAKGQDSALQIAEKLVTNADVIPFAGGAMEVEPGLLSGFDNYEVKGFQSGAMFAPMIGSIAFVGYVFELEAGADADAFVNELTTNANPRWNVCVEAEETVTAVEGSKVFFVMSPLSFEE